MKRVLHIISGLGTGGAEANLVRVASGLRELEFDQTVVSLKGDGSNADALRDAGIAVYPLDLWNPLSWIKLVRSAWKGRPDVIQGWMYHGNIAAALLQELLPGKSDRRLFWNIRASNMDADRYARIICWSAALSHWPDIVIANSGAGLDCHVAAGFQPRKCQVIHNGIDTDTFRPDASIRKAIRREFGYAEDDVVAIHVARVDPMKDHPAFLAAMRALPDVRGLLVGLDTETLDLPSNVKALGLRSDVPQLYAAADIIVSSSAFGEGFSNTLAEGMSCGLAPVATDVGESALIVGDTGTLVPPGDASALTKAIASLISSGRAAIGKRGRTARKRIVQHFGLGRSVAAYAAIYLGSVDATPKRKGTSV